MVTKTLTRLFADSLKSETSLHIRAKCTVKEGKFTLQFVSLVVYLISVLPSEIETLKSGKGDLLMS